MIINMENILEDTNPIIREKSAPVALPLSKEDHNLVMDLLQFVLDSRDPEQVKERNIRPASGIAAIQIGIRKQMLAVVVEDEDCESDRIIKYALVNPVIISSSVQASYLKNGEGCLSVEGIHEGIVPRHARIKVKAYDALKNETVEIRARGYVAIVLQHEIDHLTGILFYDRIQKEDPWRPINNAIIVE